MDFALTPEDEQFAAELRSWLDEHLPGFLEREELDSSSSLSGEQSQLRRAAWQRTLNQGRWAAANWPEEYGGRNATAMQRIIYSEIMAEYRTPGMFNTNGLWQIGPMIIAWGTEEQKAQWLPSILDATEHWCQGFSEPDAGNDLANLRTTAILDGDDYVVNGQKIWISTAHLAKWGLFLLRTDPTAIERGAKHEGITAFILDLETPGIERRPIRDMAGEEMFNEVFFTDARIPVGCRLGGEGEGWMVAMGTLGHERVGDRHSASHPGCRPASHGDCGASGQRRCPRGPSTAGPHRPGVDRHRTGPPAVAAGAVQDHQGGEELAGGSLRQVELVGPGPDPGRPVSGPARPSRCAGPWRTRLRGPREVDPALLVPAL